MRDVRDTDREKKGEEKKPFIIYSGTIESWLAHTEWIVHRQTSTMMMNDIYHTELIIYHREYSGSCRMQWPPS